MSFWPLILSCILVLHRLGVHLARTPNERSISLRMGSIVKATAKPRSAVILHTLLQRSRIVDDGPYQPIRQIFELMSCLFPTPSPDFAESNSRWMLSGILDDLEQREFLGRRPEMPTCWSAYRLGQGVLSVGEWFVQQELNHSRTCPGLSWKVRRSTSVSWPSRR